MHSWMDPSYVDPRRVIEYRGFTVTIMESDGFDVIGEVERYGDATSFRLTATAGRRFRKIRSLVRECIDDLTEYQNKKEHAHAIV